MVLSTLNTGILPLAINHTFIALVPKCKNPKRITEFHRISLHNVVYKLISKVLTNRLKLVLPLIIFESQSAFVPWRLITDNVLIAYTAVTF